VALAIVGATMLAGGCSSSEGILNGDVTFDGSPLKEGVARFVPAEGKGTTSTANISGGQFRASLVAGDYRVEFSAPKVIGKRRMMPESPEVDEVIELLPEKYNVKSEMKVSIKPGTQEKKFELSSK
jgi:hypothetical protein